MEKFLFIVEDEDKDMRLDAFIASKIREMTRSYVQKLVSDGMIKINGFNAKKSYITKISDNISVVVPDADNMEIVPEDIPLEIPYEDEDLLVVNKPKNMVVHPAPGNYSGTLVNALLFYCKGSLSGINGILRPGIVHRIDKDTSGLLLVAKNDFSHKCLAKQISYHTLKREYECIVTGNLKNDSGTIDLPIGRHPVHRKKMAVVYNHTKEALTNYEVIKRYDKFTHIRLKLKTGRTHQIRVHMSHLGHPVAGDEVYGKGSGPSYLGGQCLHARTLGFVHPRTQKNIEITSELPYYFSRFIKDLEK